MKISIARHSPVTALTTMTLLTVAAYARFALMPYENERAVAAVKVPVAEWLSMFGESFPVWSLAAAALVTVITGCVVGRMCSRLRLYPTQCFMAMPLYAVAACGVFISSDPLAASLMSLLAALMLNNLGRGYLKGQDLASMLYAGLCIGSMTMLSAPAGVACVALALLAIPMLSLSFREMMVLIFSTVLAPAAVCYGVWAFGGEFAGPVMRFAESLVEPSGVAVFGDDAVMALVLCGLLGYTAVCGAVLFFANRFAVALKSRGIHIYIIAAGAVLSSVCALPSATPAMLGVVAVPLSMIMPVMFMNTGERSSLLLYLSLLAAFGAHAWVL